jgi:O-antigen/teichoic acid export membrane protein
MGIIKKQSIQSTIYNYLGVGLGFLNSVILMPILLTEEQVGLFQFLNSFSSIFVGFCTFGIPLISIKIFPRLRNESKSHHGYFAFLLLTTIIGSILGVLFFGIAGDWLISDENGAKQFAPFALVFSILLVVRVFARNFDSYIRMLMNTVLGTFSENFLLKLIVSGALGYYWLVNGYDFVTLFIIYAFALAIPGIVSISYIIFKGLFNLQLGAFQNATRGWRKEILTLSAYGLLGTLGSIIILEVDTIMVSNMLGLKQTAIYKTAFFFGLFCSIPARALRRISVVVIAEAWEKNDLETIKDVYHKSSLTLFIFGAYLFLGVWVNLDYVFQIIPESYAAGKLVILIIGIAQLVDLVSGVNTEIIASSPYYKFTSYFIAVLIVLVVALNYLLIPSFGIEGAAVASLISLTIYNLLKFVFLQRKLKYQPLSYKVIVIIIISCIAWVITTYTLPVFEDIYIGILITGSLLTVIYWVPVYLLRVSSDVNDTIDKFIKIKRL